MNVPLSLTSKSFAEVETFVQSYYVFTEINFSQNSLEAVQQLIYANLAYSFS